MPQFTPEDFPPFLPSPSVICSHRRSSSSHHQLPALAVSNSESVVGPVTGRSDLSCKSHPQLSNGVRPAPAPLSPAVPVTAPDGVLLVRWLCRASDLRRPPTGQIKPTSHQRRHHPPTLMELSAGAVGTRRPRHSPDQQRCRIDPARLQSIDWQ